MSIPDVIKGHGSQASIYHHPDIDPAPSSQFASIATVAQIQREPRPAQTHENGSSPEGWKWALLIIFFATTAILHRIIGRKRGGPRPPDDPHDNGSGGTAAGGGRGGLGAPRITPPNSSAMSAISQNGPALGIFSYLARPLLPSTVMVNLSPFLTCRI